jgi:hypothetical protein
MPQGMFPNRCESAIARSRIILAGEQAGNRVPPMGLGEHQLEIAINRRLTAVFEAVGSPLQTDLCSRHRSSRRITSPTGPSSDDTASDGASGVGCFCRFRVG